MTPPTRLLSLDGRVAIVTGGAGRLGSAIARCLASFGATVAVVDRDADTSAQAAREVSVKGAPPAFAVPVDLMDSDAVSALPARVVDVAGRLDVIVNCAAFVGTSASVGWATSFETQRVEIWRDALEVNLTAPFVLVQAALPYLRASGHASVVNIGSIYGILGPDWDLYAGTSLGNPAAYAASKGGLLQLTRWLATTLAPDVRVNAVSPGGIMRGHEDPFLAKYVARTPMRRMATEEDVVGAVAYFASDLSSYVTGQHLAVDVGWSSW